MKNLYFTILALISIFSTQAQQFSFNVYFEDGMGNRDTIILGYDSNISDTINPQYGEVNILNQPWDSVFEVRLSEFDYDIPWSNNYNPSFQTKKKILNFIPQPPCIYSSTPIFIAVKNKYRPFHFTWDSTLFQDTVRMSSGFQFYHYICPGAIWASSTDSLMFENPWYYCQSCHVEQNGDTLWMIGFAFSYLNTIGIPRPDNKNIVVKTYPNPAEDFVIFDLENIYQNAELIIYNSTGKLISKEHLTHTKSHHKINISDYKSGIYFCRILSEDGQLEYSGKFVKK